MDIQSLSALISEYGPFVALVVYMLWENNKREKNSRAREEEFINESRAREQKYIEREEKYIDVIGSLTSSFEEIRDDVSYIKENFTKGGEG